MSVATRTVRVEREGFIAWLVFDRPQAAHALNRDLVNETRAALNDLRAASDFRVLALTGTGDKAFCAGADLKERLTLSLDETRAFLADLNALADELAGFPTPVVAALNGAALGGGAELALACDVRFMAEHAQMAFPEVRLGIIPGAGGTQRLARLVGPAVAKDLILTGRRVDAARALSLGLVNEVAPGADLRAAVQRWANDVADAGPLAVAQAKRAIDEGAGLPLAAALAIERQAYDVVLASADRNEGLQAFAAKRKPVFSGK